jgi:tRNA A-37 threonylcarbamoyl transferase component Bud32
MLSADDRWVRVRCGGIDWHVRGRFLSRFRDWCEKHFPAALDKADGLLKNTRGSRVAAADGWVIKESAARRGRSRLRYGLRRSGADRAARLALRAVSAGIPTPEPMAWATVRSGILRVREYLVTEEVPNARPLTALLAGTAPLDPTRAVVAREYGRLLGMFHGAGLSNRDMKDQNVLVAGDSDLRVLDMDGVQVMPVLPRWRAGRDFYAVVRSLGIYSWREPETLHALLEGYNSQVPPRLRRDAVPFRRVFLTDSFSRKRSPGGGA